jgi:hypothetical protein
MNSNERSTRRNRHIDRRHFYAREEFQSGKLSFHHVGADYSLADVGTKNLTAEEAAYKLSVMEHPISTPAPV